MSPLRRYPKPCKIIFGWMDSRIGFEASRSPGIKGENMGQDLLARSTPGIPEILTRMLSEK